MLSVTSWNIHTSDGVYVGQAASLAPSVALVKCLSLAGEIVEANELILEEIDGDSARAFYGSQEYILTRQP